MDWSNERYVRVYVRDTKTWLKARWQGQCLFMMLLRKSDRAGILDNIDDPIYDLELITGLPSEHVKVGYQNLIRLGVIEQREETLLIPNFIEAQESSKSNAQRQRESREKKRAVAKQKTVTNCDNMKSQNVTSESQNVTDPLQPVTTCHNLSQPVTPTRADPVLIPCCADPVLNKEKNKKKKTPDPDFEIFWKAYPARRRQAKLAAQKAWDKAKANGLPPIENLLAILERHKNSWGWTKDNGEYIPGPAPWLNQGRWLDEVTEDDDPEPYYEPLN